MKAKFTILSAIAVSMFGHSVAAIEISDDLSLIGKVGIASDYRSYGISQTQNDPALQAGVTIFHSSGAYLGVYTTNVDFGYGSRARQEVDSYVGYYWSITDDVSLDVAYLDYTYVHDKTLNSGDLHAELKAYGAYVGAYHSTNVDGDEIKLNYDYVGYKTHEIYGVTLNAKYGRANYKSPVFVSGSGNTRRSYNDWQVELVRNFSGVEVSLSYVDTNLSRAECISFMGFDDVCSSRLVAAVSKSF